MHHVLCIVCYVLGDHVLCTMHYVLCIVNYVLCIMCCELYISYYVLCTMCYVLCTMYSTTPHHRTQKDIILYNTISYHAKQYEQYHAILCNTTPLHTMPLYCNELCGSAFCRMYSEVWNGILSHHTIPSHRIQQRT